MAMENASPAVQTVRGRRQEKIGLVTSAKMAKTIVVKVTRMFEHRKYKRVIRKSSKFYAHDETGMAHAGDTVRIVETRPLSKLKRWRLVEVVAKNTRAD
jgi:small subunit ribosomal protein S17